MGQRVTNSQSSTWTLILIFHIVFLLLLAPREVSSSKILMVFPSFSKSHLIIATSVMKGLAEAGHEVTVVSSFPQKEKIPNYRDVYLELPAEFKSKSITHFFCRNDFHFELKFLSSFLSQKW